MSKIKVNEIEKASGSGITVPTGTSFTITDGLAVSSLPTVTVAKGGTNLTSFTAGDLLYATGSTTLAKLPKGTASQALLMNAGATAPEWGTAPSGKVKQMVYVSDANTYTGTVSGGSSSTSSRTGTVIFGTITPTSASNKIYATWMIPQIDWEDEGHSGMYLEVWRSINGGSYAELTAMNGTHGSSSRHNTYMGNYNLDGDLNRTVGSGFSGVFYDNSHNTTNAINYRMYIGMADNQTKDFYVNRTGSNGDQVYTNCTRSHCIFTECE